MNLFQLTGEMLAIDEALNATGGEIDTEMEAYFLTLQEGQRQKLDELVQLVWKWQGEARAAHAPANVFAGIVKSREKAADKMLKRILKYLVETKQKRVDTASGIPLAVLGVGGVMPMKVDEALNLDTVPANFIKTERYLDTVQVREWLEAEEKKPAEERQRLAFASLLPRGVRLKVG